jgi:hypothetical protein
MDFFESHGAERAHPRGAASSNGHGRFAEAGIRKPVAPGA